MPPSLFSGAPAVGTWVGLLGLPTAILRPKALSRRASPAPTAGARAHGGALFEHVAIVPRLWAIERVRSRRATSRRCDTGLVERQSRTIEASRAGGCSGCELFPAEPRSAVMCGASGAAPSTVSKTSRKARLAVSQSSPRTGTLSPALFECAPARSAVKAPLACVHARERSSGSPPLTAAPARRQRQLEQAAAAGWTRLAALTSCQMPTKTTELCGTRACIGRCAAWNWPAQRHDEEIGSEQSRHLRRRRNALAGCCGRWD
jgi:hypothetical protein